MAGHLARLGERIRELRAEMPAAVVARRAGITPAYLHAIENAGVNKSTGQPSTPSIPVLRSIAWAIPGAVASELLELAGYEEDIIAYDRMREKRDERARVEVEVGPAPLTPDALASELRRLLERLEGREGQSDERVGPGAQRRRVGGPGTSGTGTHYKGSA